jgi:hypothetical protein
LAEVQHEVEAHKKSDIFQLRQTVEKAEATGGDPLHDLAKQLMREISERQIRLNAMQR